MVKNRSTYCDVYISLNYRTKLQLYIALNYRNKLQLYIALNYREPTQFEFGKKHSCLLQQEVQSTVN